MRLGKKKERERESESRRDVVDGVTRVLASTKSHPVTGLYSSPTHVFRYLTFV